ncbi:MAG: NIPSNAP family protein [Actinomycetota bacterium]
MFYRMRTYQAVKENLADFHVYFHKRLLPIQERHGARLVGRWETEDHRVVSIWEYDSREEYQRVHRAVRDDPDTAFAEEIRRTLGPLYTNMSEVFALATGD